MAVHDHDSIYLQTNKYLSEGFVNDYAILVRDIYSYPLQTAKGQVSLDYFRNCKDLSEIKLQKILFFANMISFAKFEKPLFYDWGDFMAGKESPFLDSPEDECFVLDMAFGIFGNLTEEELSMLLAEFDADNLAKKGEPSENDITRIRAVIDAFENEKDSVYRKEILNGSKFYINRKCFSGDLIVKLEEFSKTCLEDAYIVCEDKGTLLIY